MTDIVPIVAGLLAATIVLDGMVRPRGRNVIMMRSFAGLWLHGLAMLAMLGLVLALCGNALASALTVLAFMAGVVLGSNAKHRVLGEPLLFSDLALVRAIFRHPQFYFTALTRPQLLALAAGAVAVPAGLAWLFVVAAGPHLLGVVLLAGALAGLMICVTLSPWRHLALRPDAEADVMRHGLVATLILYWLRWRATPDPAPLAAPLSGAAAATLVVIVQCESFADPVDLFGDPALALPGLSAARAAAWRWGQLQVPGFGAYTMRTEYGVMFGRDETALGFRRYDPFLTAAREASYALPARLAPSGWNSLFVHPHDMRFYGRDAILPSAGFAELIGMDQFAPPGPGDGRYVSDAAIADMVMARARAATGPTLIHAVTIENHGPWPLDRPGTNQNVSGAYMALVRKGDAMLARLQAEMAALRRPALLVFYGDHRPSIPGATSPDGARHTPFVMLRFGEAGVDVQGHGLPLDLTPAQLHHMMLAAITTGVNGDFSRA